jgi:hypothetical protein
VLGIHRTVRPRYPLDYAILSDLNSMGEEQPGVSAREAHAAAGEHAVNARTTARSLSADGHRRSVREPHSIRVAAKLPYAESWGALRRSASDP